jgi:hypothetical protein
MILFRCGLAAFSRTESMLSRSLQILVKVPPSHKYSRLAGSYANFRLMDGEYKPTGGTITLAWQPDGSFAVKGLHHDGTVEWGWCYTHEFRQYGHRRL